MRKYIFFFSFGLFTGLLLSALLGLIPGLGFYTPALAEKPHQLDIVYKVATQNYYLTQKILAFEEYQAEVLGKITDKNKIKPEDIYPLKNRLQQEIFTLDLKIKEVNR